MQASNLAVKAIGSDQARLTWDAPLYVTQAFVIFRGTSDDFQAAVQIANVDVNATLYNDYGLAPATQYWWWVLVVSFAPAGPVTATTDPAPVPGPFIKPLMDALYDWVAGVMAPNFAIIWSSQSGPKPLKPFVELMLTGPIKVPGTDHPSANGKLLSGMRRYTVSVHCITEPLHADGDDAKDAMEYAGNLIASLDDEAVTDAFNAAQIGVADIEGPTDLSAILETKYERHVHFDFQINVPSNVAASNSGVIDTVVVPEITLTA